MAAKKTKAKAKKAAPKKAKAKPVAKAKKGAPKVKPQAKVAKSAPKKTQAPKAKEVKGTGKKALIAGAVATAAVGVLGKKTKADLKPVPSRFDDLYDSEKTVDDLDEFAMTEFEDDEAPRDDEAPVDEEEVEEVEAAADDEDGLNFDDSIASKKKRDEFFEDLDMYESDNERTSADTIIEGDDDESF